MRRAQTVIYLDSSVALAHILGEPRRLPDSLWDEPLISSRLLEYEVWNRVHARGFTRLHEATRELISRIDLLELDSDCLARALEPFPVAVRTLDALHLASIEFLREHGIDVELASLDERLLQAAHVLNIPVYEC
jgi:predicted nucleic acid-binding protein